MDRNERSLDRSTCQKCGYAVSGPAGSICPECGSPLELPEKPKDTFASVFPVLAHWPMTKLGAVFGTGSAILIVVVPGPHAGTSLWPIVFPLEPIFFPNHCSTILGFCAGGIAQWTALGFLFDIGWRFFRHRGLGVESKSPDRRDSGGSD